MQWLKKLKTSFTSFWNRNKLSVSVFTVAAGTILSFVADYFIQHSASDDEGAASGLLDLWAAIGIVVLTALLAVPLINGAMTVLRYPSRLDTMVRQSLSFVAGLIVAVLVFLTWTPIPRVLGIDGMGSWQKLLTAGGVVTLTAAIVGLVISYRKQRDAEDNKFNRNFAEAAAQLGDNSPAVRIAGVYAMSALADDHYLRRQQCIDVLCGHLRIPYSPGPNQEGVSMLTVEEDDGTKVRTETYAYSPGEREVRQSILRVIRDRLHPDSTEGWYGFDFDFTGAFIENVNFAEALFSGGNVSFDAAILLDATLDFRSVELVDATVSFKDTKFKNSRLVFENMGIENGVLNFAGAEFHDTDISLAVTSMISGLQDFSKVRFNNSHLDYAGSFFGGGRINFIGAALEDSILNFEHAQFRSCDLNLDSISLLSSNISFDDVVFLEEGSATVSLRDANVADGTILRDGEDFKGHGDRERKPSF